MRGALGARLGRSRRPLGLKPPSVWPLGDGCMGVELIPLGAAGLSADWSFSWSSDDLGRDSPCLGRGSVSLVGA